MQRNYRADFLGLLPANSNSQKPACYSVYDADSSFHKSQFTMQRNHRADFQELLPANSNSPKQACYSVYDLKS